MQFVCLTGLHELPGILHIVLPIFVYFIYRCGTLYFTTYGLNCNMDGQIAGSTKKYISVYIKTDKKTK